MDKYDWYWYSCWYLLLPCFPFSPHVWSFILFIYFHIRSYSHALLRWSLFLVLLSSSAIISVWHKTVASLLPYFDNPRLILCIIYCWSWQLFHNVSLHFVVGKSNLLWVRHWPSPFLSSSMLFHVRHNSKHFFAPVAETQSIHLEIFIEKGVLKNMQQIYRRTPILKCDFNKVALQL